LPVKTIQTDFWWRPNSNVNCAIENDRFLAIRKALRDRNVVGCFRSPPEMNVRSADYVSAGRSKGAFLPTKLRKGMTALVVNGP
jgi:hypothetical protein